MTILSIHGFASSGEGEKAEALRETFANDKIISPTLPIHPKRAINLLKETVYNEEDLRISGTSLGGFYALYLAVLYDKKALVINPVTNPSYVMTNVLGTNTNYKTGENFEWTKEHLNALSEMEKDLQNAQKKDWDNIVVAIGKRDDIIDINVTANYFSEKLTPLYFDDDHRFSNFKEAIKDERIQKVFL